jgi:hypothetical protein
MSDERDPDDGYWDDEPWTDEDERRYQERRARELSSRHRRRRQAAVFAVLVLLVLGTGTTAAGVYSGWWEWPPWQGEPAPVRTVVACPTPEVTAAAVADVALTVLNSTDRAGLAGATAAELTARGFTVGGVGNDPAPEPLPGTAVVRHGPEGLLAARTVAAQVDGATLQDDGRAGSAVELSLGQAFAGLRPPEAAAAAVAPAPVASPAGCVAPTPATTESAPVQPAASQPAPTG